MRTRYLVVAALIAASMLACRRAAPRGYVDHLMVPDGDARVFVGDKGAEVVFPVLSRSDWTVGEPNCNGNGLHWGVLFEAPPSFGVAASGAPNASDGPFNQFTLVVWPDSSRRMSSVLEVSRAAEVRGCLRSGSHFLICAYDVGGTARVAGGRMVVHLPRSPATAPLLDSRPERARLSVRLNCETLYEETVSVAYLPPPAGG